MKFFLIVSILVLASLTVFSKAEIEKIIDENDLVIIDGPASTIPERYRKLVNAFGVVEYSVEDRDGTLQNTYFGCTATHIGRGYVLTAGHCIGATETLSAQPNCNFRSQSPDQKDSERISEIHFGFRDFIAPFMNSKCIEVVAAMKNDVAGIDFAILRISPYPEEFILPDTTRRAVYGDSVTIFSHPMGQVLQWSQTCGIERQPHPEISQSYIQHKCDTRPVSSGATLINILSLKVIGIHVGGVNDMDPDTGDILSSGMNYGSYIFNSPLYDELKKIGF